MSPLKNGSLKNELENVPPPLGNRVRRQMRPRTTPQAYRSSPSGVISSVAGISSPPRKNVANKPHAKHRTLPLNPPIPSMSDVANDSRAAVLLPNMACAMRPPSSLPHGNKFKDVTTIPVEKNMEECKRLVMRFAMCSCGEDGKYLKGQQKQGDPQGPLHLPLRRAGHCQGHLCKVL